MCNLILDTDLLMNSETYSIGEFENEMEEGVLLGKENIVDDIIDNEYSDDGFVPGD